jgi:phosphoribosylglycinamide formyltransferase 1
VRVAVLASGSGSNLQALIDRFNTDTPTAARVELLIASRSGIGAIARAGAAGIPSVVLDPRIVGPERLEEEILRELEAHRVDLIVLAGYLQLVPRGVVDRFRGRMINVHPALLPAFGGHGMYGARVHRAVLASGVRVSGVTVHEVHEAFDSGTILAQWPVPVLAGDTEETLAARVLAIEHRLLPAVVELLATGGGRTTAAEAQFSLRPGTLPERDELRELVAAEVP